MNTMNSTQPQEQQEIDLQAPVEAPSYAACVDWMNAIPEATSRTFDVWNRGNFIRRVLHNRSREIHPILVPAANTDQMKSAYRRLALVGMAVDFVYTGPISKPHSVMHLWPWEGVPVDAGWGYVVPDGGSWRVLSLVLRQALPFTPFLMCSVVGACEAVAESGV